MFTPGYIKHGRLLIRHAEKLLRYRKDVLSETTISEVKEHLAKVRKALSDRDQKAVESESQRLHDLYTKHMPTPKDAAWRENVEVILVAIVVAIGIRSYFLQPFKIPTGSMQPTLNGIIGHPSKAPAPNMVRQIAEFFILGRNYINVVSAEDDRVDRIEPKRIAFFFTFSRIICDKQTFFVYAPPETLTQDFKVQHDRRYKKGETIAQGAVDTGDQVFVDKFSYNFVKPHRSDVFVFRTDSIPGIDPRVGPTMFMRSPSAQAEESAPFYIKRLVGEPDDTLKIEPPRMYVNGKPPDEFGMKRVISAISPYGGYGLGREQVDVFWRGSLIHVDLAKGFQVPEHGYFAMGDNSYNSLDSRYWGPVPEENLVGRGLFVYWPFNRHWGLIR